MQPNTPIVGQYMEMRPVTDRGKLPSSKVTTWDPFYKYDLDIFKIY